MPMSPRLLRPRQTIHPEAADWANRVRTNGGSVSGTTLTAVDRFVNAIHAAGIRDRFYRLNLFAGNSDASLNAVRTPLFRGPSLTGTQYGGATDTNVNFVAGDYAETGASGGLLGNGSTKYLTTGLTPAALPGVSTGHLSVYAMTGFGGATVYALLSSLGPALANNFFIEANRDTAGGWRFTGAWGGDSFLRGVTTGSGNGHALVSRNSSTSLTFYRNTSGTALTNNTVSVTPSSHTNAWVIFGHGTSGSPLNLAAARLGGYSIGADMTGSQAAAFYTAMQTFQTALGRQV